MKQLTGVPILCALAHWRRSLVWGALFLCAVTELYGQNSCGQVLASWEGIPAYSNGPDQWKTMDCDPYNLKPPYGAFGEQFQCTEFVKRFYAHLGDTSAAKWTGNAYDYFASANTDLTPPSVGAYANNKNLLHIPNPGTSPPAPDDILVFRGPNLEGHVAIVTNVTATTVTFIEQNWSVTGTSSLPLSTTCSGAGCTYTISNRISYPKDSPTPVTFTVVGWLREPSWLTFIEGNPGIPGDRIVITGGIGGQYYDLVTPIPLAALTNGFTFTVFPAGAQGTLSQFQIDIVNLNDNSLCPNAGVGVSFAAPFSTTSFNGVEGYFLTQPPSTIPWFVSTMNTFYPSCQMTVNDLFITTIVLSTTSLDAAAVGYGVDLIPGVQLVEEAVQPEVKTEATGQPRKPTAIPLP